MTGLEDKLNQVVEYFNRLTGYLGEIRNREAGRATAVIYLRIPGELGVDEQVEVDWFDGQSRSQGRERLSDISEKVAGRRVIVLTPAADVALQVTEVPVKNRQRLLKALPYILEDQFGADIESLHFAPASRIRNGRVAVAVVARETMHRWQQALFLAGIEPVAMIPESLAIPQEGEDWSLMIHSGVATLRCAMFSVYSLPSSKLESLLRLSLDQVAIRPLRRLVYFHTSDEQEENKKFLQQFCDERNIELLHERKDSLMALYASGLGEKPDIDLMQNEYARKDDFARYWKPWRSVAVLLLVLLLLNFGIRVYDYVVLSRQDDALKRQVEQVYMDVFPDTRNLVDPRVQMEQRLKTLKLGGRQDDFLSLLSIVGPVLKHAPSLELEALRYRQSTLDVDMRIKDFHSLDKLKADFSRLTDIKMTVTSANTEQGQVRTQLRIQWVGA